MAITTISSREFNQDIGAAKKAAKTSIVFITSRGKTTHVLLSIDEYQKMSSSNVSIVDLLAMPSEAADIEFDIPKLSHSIFQEVDFD